jgi:outer membrane immunogenic protein
MYQLRSRVVSAVGAAVIVFAALPALADGYAGGYSPGYAPTSWTGLYIGAHGGYAWGDFDGPLSYDDAPLFPASIFDSSEKSIDADGWFGGFQAGFNKQLGTVVVGLEADVSWTDNDGRGTFLPYPAQGPDPAWNIETELEMFGTVRGRLGFLATPDLLVYGTGGFAWAQVDSNISVTYSLTPCNGGPCATGSADNNHFGWTLGAGAEWKLSRNWSLKSEYLFVDLGTEDYAYVGSTLPPLGPGPYDTDHFHADLELHTVRVGLNYQFGGDREAPAPLK